MNIMADTAVKPRAPAEDLAQLQKEYRNMEMNRRAYAEESASVMRRQQMQLERLLKENESMKEEIYLHTRSQFTVQDVTKAHLYASLKEQADTFSSQAQASRNTLKQLEDESKTLRKQILSQRKHVGGVNAVKDNQALIAKQIKVLEHRLDKALVRFNESLADNKCLRDDIEHLRKEKEVFEAISSKLQRELDQQHKSMAEIIETSNKAYAERDAAQREIALLEVTERREDEEHARRISEMEAEARRISKDQIRQSQNKEFSSNSDRTTSADTKSDGSPVDHKESLLELKEAAQQLEDVLREIKAAAGLEDTKAVVEAFLRNEERNFSLFNFVNEQQNDIDKLQEEVELLKVEQAQCSSNTGSVVKTATHVTRDLEEKLFQAQKMIDKVGEENARIYSELDAVKQNVSRLLVPLAEVDERMSSLLQKGVSDVNMLQTLGTVEDSMTMLIQRHGQDLRETDCSKSALGDDLEENWASIQITPPNLEDSQSDEEDKGKPLSLEELTKTALNSYRTNNS